MAGAEAAGSSATARSIVRAATSGAPSTVGLEAPPGERSGLRVARAGARRLRGGDRRAARLVAAAPGDAGGTATAAPATAEATSASATSPRRPGARALVACIPHHDGLARRSPVVRRGAGSARRAAGGALPGRSDAGSVSAARSARSRSPRARPRPRRLAQGRPARWRPRPGVSTSAPRAASAAEGSAARPQASAAISARQERAGVQVPVARRDAERPQSTRSTASTRRDAARPQRGAQRRIDDHRIELDDPLPLQRPSARHELHEGRARARRHRSMASSPRCLSNCSERRSGGVNTDGPPRCSRAPRCASADRR